MEYCVEKIPAYKPLSVSGYHIREAGSTAAQELAFTLADGFGYVELGLSRGLDVDVFAPGLSFFFDAHVDFFEEIAKFRAARRIWARWLRDVYGAKTEKAQWLRFHTQTAGVSLTAQQPYNNVVRTGIEALSAVLGGTNSLHTNALDETLALPSEQAAEIALRTQQVIMEETGVVNVADPLGGSWYVEALTDKIEAEANAIFDKILAMGGSDLTHADTEKLAEKMRTSTGEADAAEWPMTRGLLRGIEDGWFMSEIAEAAFQYQVALEKGEKKIVGVNCHEDSVTHELEILRVSHEVEIEQVRELAERRVARDDDAARAAVQKMVDVSRTDENMIDVDARRRSAPRPRSARSATRCAPSGASTGSPRASEPPPILGWARALGSRSPHAQVVARRRPPGRPGRRARLAPTPRCRPARSCATAGSPAPPSWPAGACTRRCRAPACWRMSPPLDGPGLQCRRPRSRRSATSTSTPPTGGWRCGAGWHARVPAGRGADLPVLREAGRAAGPARPARSTSSRGMDSRVSLITDAEGAQWAAGWLRTLRATGEYVFSGCYAHRRLPGRRALERARRVPARERQRPGVPPARGRRRGIAGAQLAGRGVRRQRRVRRGRATAGRRTPPTCRCASASTCTSTTRASCAPTTRSGCGRRSVMQLHYRLEPKPAI